MELVSQIINDLVDDDKSLTTALLKTKVLASRIQSEELLNWVNSELTGYINLEHLPEYRQNIPTYIKGQYINGNQHITGGDIPTDGLAPDIEKRLLTQNFLDSVKGLEKTVIQNPSTVTMPVSPDFVAIVELNIKNMGYPYFNLLEIHKIISTNLIVELLSNVRSKLLDFILEIDQKFGSLAEIKDLKMKSEEIKSIVNNTIIQGDGNVFNTGEKAKIKNTNKINKSNKTDLINALKDNGVSDGDISELVEIIDQEEPASTTNLGPLANGWIGKMYSKALDGSWNVAVGAAGGLLVELIKQYYGM